MTNNQTQPPQGRSPKSSDHSALERLRNVLNQEERDYEQAMASIKKEEDFLNEEEEACQILAYRHPSAAQDLLIASQNLLSSYRDEVLHRKDTLNKHHDQTVDELHRAMREREQA